MSDATFWSSAVLFGLGAFHGVNPGMGWLFAVALGLQEGRSRAVWRALVPLTLGHSLAVGAVVGSAWLTGLVVPAGSLRLVVGGLLIGLGGYRLFRHRHTRWAGMRVGLAQLTLWSFMMATAHGAGLMVVPVVIASSPTVSAASTTQPLHHAEGATSVRGHVTASGAPDERLGPILASLVHGAGYLVVTALLAWLVFAWVGVGVLRTAWINLDLIWASALIVTGVGTLLVA
jgi:hypothetical protein